MEKYFIYQITNLINNKKYFGSTNDIERRWREHKSNSFNPNAHSYNYPLALAFRKYGLENFYFYQFPQVFNSRYEAEEFEHQLIIENQTHLHNGYNQTSITHNALTDGEIRNGLKHKIIAIDINNPNTTKYFDSVTNAAKYFITDRHSVSKCAQGIKRYSNVKQQVFRYLDENNNIIEPKLTSKEVIDDYNRKNPYINGERHNITEWCKIYGITRTCYYKRLKQGYDYIEALTMPKKK